MRYLDKKGCERFYFRKDNTSDEKEEKNHYNDEEDPYGDEENVGILFLSRSFGDVFTLK